MEKYYIFTDGGKADIGLTTVISGAFVILNSKQEIILQATILKENATNQYAELKTAVIAMEKFIKKVVKENCTIDFYSDSKYVIDGMNKWIKQWLINNYKNNTILYKNLWERLYIATKNTYIKKINFIHIRGHQNNMKNIFPYKYNFLVDNLCTQRLNDYKKKGEITL